MGLGCRGCLGSPQPRVECQHKSARVHDGRAGSRRVGRPAANAHQIRACRRARPPPPLRPGLLTEYAPRPCVRRGESAGVDERWQSPAGSRVWRARCRRPGCPAGPHVPTPSAPAGAPARRPRPGRRARGDAAPVETAGAANCRRPAGASARPSGASTPADRRVRLTAPRRHQTPTGALRALPERPPLWRRQRRAVAGHAHPPPPRPGAPLLPRHHPPSLHELGRPGPVRGPRRADRIARRRRRAPRVASLPRAQDCCQGACGGVAVWGLRDRGAAQRPPPPIAPPVPASRRRTPTPCARSSFRPIQRLATCLPRWARTR